MCIQPPQLLTVLLTLVTVGTLETVAGQTGGSMRSVVPSPWVSEYVFGRAVSSDGSVMVGTGESPSSGLLWTEAGGAVDMNALLGRFVTCSGVSADGRYVLGASSTSITGHWAPFRWSATGGREDLPTFGANYATSTAASADGSVVVGTARISGFTYIGFRWTSAGGAHDLGAFGPGGTITHPSDVSADGSVVVGSASIDGVGTYRAFRWTQRTGLVNLGTGGGFASQATAVSDDGNVVVGFVSLHAGGYAAFRWTAANGMQLIPSNLSSWAAFGVSGDGTIVVGETWDFSPLYRRAFRWDATTGVVDLGTLGGESSAAVGVSDDGSVVVGWSTPFGSNRATMFRWEAGVHHPIGTMHCTTATPNSTGAVGVLDVQGNNSAQANFARLAASNLPLHSVGYFITSETAVAPMPVANSVGVLCLGGSIGRFNGPGQVLDSGASGGFTLPLDMSSVPGPTGPVAIMQGETWSFQAWHRDLVVGPTSNFTSAVSVTFR